MFGVGPDRLDDQVKFIGAVDFARHAVGLARHKAVGFGEVVVRHKVCQGWKKERAAEDS